MPALPTTPSRLAVVDRGGHHDAAALVMVTDEANRAALANVIDEQACGPMTAADLRLRSLAEQA